MDICLPKFDIYQGTVAPNCFRSRPNWCPDFFQKKKKMSSVKFNLFDVTSFLPDNLSGFKKNLIRPAIADKINDKMQRNQAKLYRTRNFDICFYVIRPLVPNFFFWKRVWVVDSVCTHFWVFPMISEFPKILSLRLFGNSWGNSYTMF